MIVTAPPVSLLIVCLSSCPAGTSAKRCETHLDMEAASATNLEVALTQGTIELRCTTHKGALWVGRMLKGVIPEGKACKEGGGTDKVRVQMMWKCTDFMVTGTGARRTGAGVSLLPVWYTACRAVQFFSRHCGIHHPLYLPPSLQAQRGRSVVVHRVWPVRSL